MVLNDPLDLLDPVGLDPLNPTKCDCQALYAKYSGIIDPLSGNGTFSTVGQALAGGYLLQSVTPKNDNYEYGFSVLSAVPISTQPITLSTTGTFSLTPIITSNLPDEVNLSGYLRQKDLPRFEYVNPRLHDYLNRPIRAYYSSGAAYGHIHPNGDFRLSGDDIMDGEYWGTISSVTTDYSHVFTLWSDPTADPDDRYTKGTLEGVVSPLDMANLTICLKNYSPTGFSPKAPVFVPIPGKN
jgi:hypothetical protein